MLLKTEMYLLYQQYSVPFVSTMLCSLIFRSHLSGQLLNFVFENQI